MKKKIILITIIILLIIIGLTLINRKDTNKVELKEPSNAINFGKTKKEKFTVDDTLVTKNKTYHFSSYIPKDYNQNKKYDLYMALPGWEGLYFQGVGANLEERFPFEALKYDKNLIVISPQLDDWGETSADDTIYLTKYMQSHYNIDKTFIAGVSGGGETLSLVLGKEPKLYTRALHVISKWDGNLNVLADSKLPLYIVIGEHDSYYGSSYAKETYQKLYNIYKSKGLTDVEIKSLLTLDVKPDSYFKGTGYEDNQHAGGQLFAYDKTVMNWLFESNISINHKLILDKQI